jgi:GNAT superfamily N-acetyltransferase
MHCAICGADAWYVCGRSGRPVCPQHSRIEVVSRLSFGSSDNLSVREASKDDYQKIIKLAEYFWNESQVVCFDKEYDIQELPAYVVSANDHVSGVLSYALEPKPLIVVMLSVLPGYQGLGAGRMLLDAAKERASSEKKSEILVSTSNDDLPAIYFYQKNGFHIYEIKTDEVARHHGNLEVGFAGIPCRDAIRLRYQVE